MNKQPDQERLDRLPKWAAEEIIRLRSKIVGLEARISTGPGDSNAFLNPYREGASTPLGKDPMIQFRVGEDALDGFTVQFKNGELLVQGMAPAHDDYLGVFPMSGNYVAIKHVKKGN
jgi:hypothetical protein